MSLSLRTRPGAQGLETRTAELLAAGRVDQAFAAIDRRMGLPQQPDAVSYVLRAEALRGMGDAEGAIEAIEAALRIDPDDIAANRRLLAWGNADARLRAAETIAAASLTPRLLRLSVEPLLAARPGGVGALRILHDRITGWAVWPVGAACSVVLRGAFEEIAFPIEPNPDHALARPGWSAAAFSFTRPVSEAPVTSRLEAAGVVLATAHATPNVSGALAEAAAVSPCLERRPLSIIIPIYGDAQTTAACLDSLIDQLPRAGVSRVILVDDATPDPDVRNVAERAARHPDVHLIRNERNLGFVGAVNRGLDEVAGDDVLLLNADTIVPPGFCERLTRAAYGAADIGTVTPLSNNGEIVSFPTIGKVNPLPDRAEVERLDRIAAQANAGKVVDLPSGIGFCLFVRHDCRAAVGRLQEVYHRGYYEDVDLCLTAREKGFRSVCAADVFVGHAGSRSFRADKRRLVALNSRIVSSRFPYHSAETAAFMAADPLHGARVAIETELLAGVGPFHVLVAGEAIGGDVGAQKLAEPVDAEAGSRLLFTCHGDGTVDVTGAQAYPRSLRFDSASADEIDRLCAVLRGRVRRLTFLDPGRTPLPLAERLAALASSVDLVLLDGGIASCAHSRSKIPVVRDGWRELLERIDRIEAPNAEAAAFWARLATGRPAQVTPAAGLPPQLRKNGGRLAILLPNRAVAETRLAAEIATRLSQSRPVVLVGEPFPATEFADDLAAVTGPIESGDLGNCLERHDVSFVFVAATAPVFSTGLIDTLDGLGVAVARIDWSDGAVIARPGDLLLKAGATPARIAADLMKWLNQ